VTPILIKDDPEVEWPESASVFYMMTRDGLYICRNHEFFRSCAPARDWPQGLERQSAFLVPRYPQLTRRQIELVVGFFGVVGEAHGAEAAVLLAWNRETHEIELVVPEQVAVVDQSWSGRCYPLSLRYTPPTDLPPGTFIFGDVHSHVDLPAYSSGTDVEDEEFQAGLHIVVGRIHQEPPDVHVEAVVDGERFMLDPRRVIVDYRQRALDVPRAWIDRVRVDERSWGGWGSGGPASAPVAPAAAAQGVAGQEASGCRPKEPGASEARYSEPLGGDWPASRDTDHPESGGDGRQGGQGTDGQGRLDREDPR
jgi:proteasome lid subunit RPN8/RPN11